MVTAERLEAICRLLIGGHGEDILFEWGSAPPLVILMNFEGIKLPDIHTDSVEYRSIPLKVVGEKTADRESYKLSIRIIIVNINGLRRPYKNQAQSLQSL